MKVRIKSFAESKLQEWFTKKNFDAMSPEEQEQYLKDHPNSKFATDDASSELYKANKSYDKSVDKSTGKGDKDKLQKVRSASKSLVDKLANEDNLNKISNTEVIDALLDADLSDVDDETLIKFAKVAEFVFGNNDRDKVTSVDSAYDAIRSARKMAEWNRWYNTNNYYKNKIEKGTASDAEVARYKKYKKQADQYERTHRFGSLEGKVHQAQWWRGKEDYEVYEDAKKYLKDISSDIDTDPLAKSEYEYLKNAIDSYESVYGKE